MKIKIFIICFLIAYCGVNTFSQGITDTINKIDKAGKKQGYWFKKYENGKFKYQGFFENDKPKGEFKYYYEDGSIKAISIFKDKGLSSYTKTYFPNGKIMSEGFYKNEQKDSLWKYYNGFDVVIREEFYKNNQKHGEWKTYYPDGSLTDKITWKYGVKDGPWEQHYSGGVLKTQFKNNKLEGNYQVYYPDGKLKNQGRYKDNKKEGNWIWYDFNEIPVKRFVYINDILDKKELIVYENKHPVNINYDTIAYLYLKNSNIIIKKTDNSQLQITDKIKYLFDLLGEDYFLMLNNNFIANLNAIKKIETINGNLYKVILFPKTDFDVIADEESSKALKSIFNEFK